MGSRRRLPDFPKRLIALAAASLLASEGQAAVVSWGPGGDGFWDVGSNWNGSVVPANGSDVQLTTAGTRVVTYRQNISTLSSLTIGTGNTLSVAGGTLNAGTLANTGSIAVGGGAFNVSGGLSGAMTLSGGVMNLSGTLNATGAIRLQGGTVTGGTIQQSGSNGLVLTGSSGTLDGVTVRGALNVGDANNLGAIVRINNGLTVRTESGGAPGVINLGTVTDATNNYGYGRIGFTGSQTLDNVTVNIGNTGGYGTSSIFGLDAGGTFTLGAAGVIQGAGTVGQALFVGGTNNLVNNGTIGATLSGKTLTIINSGTLTNNGVLRAAGGGTLNISPSGSWSNAGVIRVADSGSTINLNGSLTVAGLGTFDNAAGGKLNLTGSLTNTGTTLTFSSATGSMQLLGGTVTGGTIQQSGSNGLVLTGSSGTLDGVTVRGALNVGDANNLGAIVRINNGLTVRTESGGAPGVINLGTVTDATNNYGYGRIGFTGTQTLDNATVNIGNTGAYGTSSIFGLDAGGTFTLGAAGAIQGAGTVGQALFVGGTNNLVNNGTIGATLNGRTLTINNSGTLTNNGVLRAAGGGTLNISPSGSWSNAGVIRVADSGSTINLNGSLTVAGLGTFDNAAGGKLNLTGSLTNTGTTLTFSSATGSMQLLGGTVTGGTIQQSGSNGLVLTTGSGTLDGVTVRGALNVGDANNLGAIVRINNGLTVRTESGGAPGVINLGTVTDATNNYGYGRIGFTGTQTLDNATVNIGNTGAYGTSSIFGLDAGGTFTLGAAGAIQGAGTVGQALFVGGTNNLVNNGTIGATLSGRTLTINNSGTLTNNGVLRAAGGGTLNISPSGSWSNAGVIRVADSGSTINLNGSLTVAGLGTFDNAAGGKLNLTGSLTNTGTTLTFSSATGSMQLLGGTVTGGTIQQSGSNGLVLTTSSGTLDGVTVRGALNVGDANNLGAIVRINNGLTVRTESGGAPGVINLGTVTDATNYGYGRIGFTGTQTLDNATVNIGNTGAYGTSSIFGLDAGGTFTLGAAGVIQGAGTVGQALFVGGTNNLVNNGTIGATLSGRTLTINNSGTLTNNGVLRAAGGGTLNISPSGSWSNAGVIRVADSGSTINLNGSLTVAGLGTFDNAAGGKLNLTGSLTNTGTTLTFSSATGSMQLLGGTVTGGTIQQSGSNGLVLTTGSGTLDGVTVRGALNVGDANNLGAIVRINNGLTVRTESGGAPGVINLGTVTDATNNYGYGRIGFTGTQTLDNATVNIGNTGAYGTSSIFGLDAGGTFTLGAAGAIQGAGTVGQALFVGGTNNLVNNGTIGATLSGRTLTINNSGTLTNNGVLRAAGGGTLDISPGGSFTNFSGTTLTGGRYEVIGASTLQFAGGNVVTNAAMILLDSSGSILRNRSNNADALTNLASNTSGGSFTIQNGRNFTTVGAFGNAGTVGVGASSTFTTTGAFTNQANAQTQVAGGTLAATSLANAGTITGFGTVSPAVANTGSVLASGGTLRLSAGVQGSSGTVGVASGATLSLGASSSAATLAQNGGMALGANNITVSSDYSNTNFGTGNGFDRRAGVTGTGQILAAGTTQQTLSGSAVQNGSASTATLALGNMRIGQGAATASYTINNVGSGGPALRGAIQTTGITNSGLSGSGVTAQNWGALSQGSSGQTFSVSYNPTVGGALAGQSVSIVNNFDNVAGQTLQITGTAYNLAAASTIAPNPVAFANRHVGDAATQALTVGNTAPTGSFSEGLAASFSATSGAATASGSIALLAAGASNASNLVIGLDTSSAGAKSGTATVALASNGTGTSGFSNLSIGAQTITVSGNVYRLAGAATVAPVSFGNLHIGDTASRALTIVNAASNDGFSERLTASFGSASDSRITTSGSVTQLGAGQTNSSSMVVGLNTSAAGTVNGSVGLNFVSDGTGTSGLGTTALPSQSVGVSGVIQTQGSVYNYASASNASPNPVDFGNVRIGSTATQALTLTNTAPAGGFSESLNASIGGATAGITASGSFSALAAQATNSTSLKVGLDTTTAGARSGMATIALASDGTGTSGLGITALPSQTVAVGGNVYRLANPVVTTPSVTLAARVGGTAPVAPIAIANASPDSFTERLNGSFATVSGGFSRNGSISGLVAGASSSAMTVGLDTSTAGTSSGTARIVFASSGAGTTGAADAALGSSDVTLTGKVYAAAQAQLNTTTVDFGIVHKGDTPAGRGISVTNAAATSALNDSLNASISGAASPFSAVGTVTGLGAQATSASGLSIGLSTAQAGSFSSTANVTFASHDADLADLGLGSASVALKGQVNNYAVLGIEKLSGAGALSLTGATTYTFDFGDIVLGSAGVGALLDVRNLASGVADSLFGSFALGTGSPAFALTGFGNFAGLGAGMGSGNLGVAFSASNLGSFMQTISIQASGSNASGYVGALADTTLVFEGRVLSGSAAAVPEPETYAMLGGGLLLLWGRRRLQRARKAAP